jgi:hypothetical protein
MNIYLDIDGVLLRKDGTLTNNFEYFINFFVSNYNVFWLTTHCRGEVNKSLEHITKKNVVSKKTLEMLTKIKPT